MAQPPFEFEEAERYHNDEVLNTRRELQQSCANLEQLAQYCEQSYVTHQDQQVAFDQAKGYVVQSLVNVSHQLTKLSTNLTQLLTTHNNRLDNMSHNLSCIQQNLDNVQCFQAKDGIKKLGHVVTIPRQHKVVQNKCISKEGKKHLRACINFSALDNIGHGVVVAQEAKPVSFSGSGRERIQEQGKFTTSRSMTNFNKPNLNGSARQDFTLPAHLPSNTMYNGYHMDPQQQQQQLSPAFNTTTQQARFNNWMLPDELATVEQRTRTMTIDRHQYPNYDSRTMSSHDRSISSQSDEYNRMQQMRRDSGHHSGTLPAHFSNKHYGSRGSLDDSSCSSSPSLQSCKTNSSNRTQSCQDYDDGSSQPSTNGPLSDSGHGTWPVEGPVTTAPSRPISELDIFEPEYPAGDQYIPSNYVKKVQAVYNYTKKSDDELTLNVGAIVYVINEHSDGWSEGFYNGKCGYFPANFTTLRPD